MKLCPYEISGSSFFGEFVMQSCFLQLSNWSTGEIFPRVFVFTVAKLPSVNRSRQQPASLVRYRSFSPKRSLFDSCLLLPILLLERKPNLSDFWDTWYERNRRSCKFRRLCRSGSIYPLFAAGYGVTHPRTERIPERSCLH